jgi:hypothetical protein
MQRAGKQTKAPIAQNLRIQYDFIRPHMVSEGQTRAETDTPIQPQFLLFSINGSDGDMETFDNQMPLRRKAH